MTEKHEKQEKQKFYIRFNMSQRMEHIAVMLFFTVLVLTGLPQKYHDASWAQSMIMFFGGIDMTRIIHRVTGVLLAALTAYHLIYVCYSVLFQHKKLSMLFTWQDVKNAIATVRFSLGMTDEHPQHGRYDYRQKFEYWGFFFGGIIMIVTGGMLMFPIVVASVLPGQFLAAAKEMHSWEAMLALLTILIWHLYGANLSPANFPADVSIFTGKISEEKLMKEHPLEYYAITGKMPEEEAHAPEMAAAPAEAEATEAE